MRRSQNLQLLVELFLKTLIIFFKAFWVYSKTVFEKSKKHTPIELTLRFFPSQKF